MSTPTLGGKFGRDRPDYGQGAYVREMPKPATVSWKDFNGGYDVRDSREDVGQNASPYLLDMEVDRKGRLRKAPGTVLFKSFGAHSPKWFGLHAGIGLRSQVVMIDAPYVGVLREGEVVWVDAGLPTSDRPWFWTTYGDQFVFANGDQDVYSVQIDTETVTPEPTIPNGSTFFVMAGRLFVGGALIDGNTEPMGVAWGGTLGYSDFSSEGTGSELLLGDQAESDRIVEGRAMGFDTAVILCRRSVWAGRRTGDLYRPLDFANVVVGKGCASAKSVQVTFGGVLYLGDEGVELFDGSQSQHVSMAIDPDIVGMSSAEIAEVRSLYNPITQKYYLLTPRGTFVLDLLRQRWYKRSMVATGAVLFAQQFHALTWAEMAGTWGSGVGTWRDTAPYEQDIPRVLFSGDAGDGPGLFEETYENHLNFGLNFTPRWSTNLTQQTRNVLLLTTKEIRMVYQNSGTVRVSLPDNESNFKLAGSVVLPMSAEERLSRTFGLRTGRGLGLQVEILAGDPLISSLEMDFLPRGTRIETQVIETFNPNDFSTRMTFVQLPPTYHPPEGATEFVLQGSVLSTGAGSTVAIPNVSQLIPAGQQGVVRQISVYANDSTELTDLRWSLRRNGVAVPSHNQLKLHPRITSSEAGTVPATVQFADGETLDVAVTNVDGADHLVGALVYGWYWPVVSP